MKRKHITIIILLQNLAAAPWCWGNVITFRESSAQCLSQMLIELQ